MAQCMCCPLGSRHCKHLLLLSCNCSQVLHHSEYRSYCQRCMCPDRPRPVAPRNRPINCLRRSVGGTSQTDLESHGVQSAMERQLHRLDRSAIREIDPPDFWTHQTCATPVQDLHIYDVTRGGIQSARDHPTATEPYGRIAREIENATIFYSRDVWGGG